MITVEHRENLINAIVFGEFTFADAKEFEAAVLLSAKSQGPVSVLLDLRDMTGFALDVAWKDFRFAHRHTYDLWKVAIVTDNRWLAWTAWLSSVFADAETRMFEEAEKAKQWVMAACPMQKASARSEPSSITAALLLILAVALLYGNFFHNPLVFDDLNFLNNEKLLRDYSASFFTFNLRWFSYVTFGWIHHFFGTSVVWQRLFNLLLHAATVLALYRFLRFLFQTVLKDGDPSRLAFWGALIFAVHPVAVYGAGYLVERSIVMATLFSVLALHAYLQGLGSGKQRWLYLSAGLYFLAVFSKEHAVMLPFAIAAMTLLVRRPSAALLREQAGPVALFCGIGILIVLKSGGVLGQPYEPFAMQMLAAQAADQLEFRVENAYPLSILMESGLFFKYLGLWLVPYVGWMSVDMRENFPVSLFSWSYLIGLLAFAAYFLVAARLLLRGGKVGLLGFALLFPWLMFLPELATVRIQEPLVLYRSYLWMLMLPVALPLVFGKAGPRAAGVGLGVLVVLLAASAWNRLEVFSDDLALWHDAVSKYSSDKMPGVERGYLNRGLALKKQHLFEEAIADYNKAIAINPNYYVAYSNIGSANIDLFRFEEAIQYLDKAIDLNPRHANAYSNRGLAKKNMGDYEAALKDYDIAVKLAPSEAFILSNRAAVYLSMGKYVEALRDAESAIKVSPNLTSAYINRASARQGMKGAERRQAP